MSTQLPFTVDQFFAVFRQYNEAVWPAQLLLVCFALLTTALTFLPRLQWSGPAISVLLAVLWGWVGLAYHLTFFTRINPLAYAFAALSLAAGLVFLWQGVVRRRLRFAAIATARSAVGLSLVVLALVVYPAWSSHVGHDYPAMPTFGLPCPTTVFTIGILALATPPYPRSPLVIPLLWCLVGGQAALFLHVPPDLMLFLAAAVGVALLVWSRDKTAALPSTT